MGEVGCLKDGHFQNLDIGGADAKKAMIPYTKHIKIVEGDSSAGHLTVAANATTLTEKQAGTVFIVNDATITITLPPVTPSLVGAKYKFVLHGANSASAGGGGFVINTTAVLGTHFYTGYALIAHAGVSDPDKAFIPNGSTNDIFTCNGGTTGGLVTGDTGDMNMGNIIEVQCISSEPGVAWYIAAELSGVGGGETPFTG